MADSDCLGERCVAQCGGSFDQVEVPPGKCGTLVGEQVGGSECDVGAEFVGPGGELPRQCRHVNLRAVRVYDDGVGRDRLGPASGEGGQVGLDRHTVEADRLLDRRPGDRQHAVLVGETEEEDVGRSRRAEQLLGNACGVDVAVALGQRRRRDLGPQFVELWIRNLGPADHRSGGGLARRTDQHRAGRVARRERGGAGGAQQVEGDDDVGALIADQV